MGEATETVTFSELKNEEASLPEGDQVDFWEELEKPADIGTYVWLAGMVVEVDGTPSRAFVTARSKTLAVDKVYEIITSDIIKFDGSEYTTKTQAIKGYFADHDRRDIFLMLCPLE